jgi:thioredoxin-related protein
MQTLLIVILIILALQSFLVVALLRSHADILKRLHDLENFGEPKHESSQDLEGPVSDITGVSPEEKVVSIAINSFKQVVLLCFLSSGCHTCKFFWNDLSDEIMSDLKVTPLIVTKGPNREDSKLIKALYNSKVRCVMSDDTWSAFKVPTTPYFVLLDITGRKIGEGTAVNIDSLKSFVSQSLRDRRQEKIMQNLNRSAMKDREDLVDQTLRDAGIFKGHPSLSGDKDA